MDTVKADSMGTRAKEARWKRARQIFGGMKQRCENMNHDDFVNYGMRGIEVRFDSVEDLVSHIGLPPPGMQIDRIDNDGHYEWGNVRWTDCSTNLFNRRSFPKSPNLKRSVVRAIVSLGRIGMKHRQIAIMFGLKRKRVTNILNGHAYSKLTGIKPKRVRNYKLEAAYLMRKKVIT